MIRHRYLLHSNSPAALSFNTQKSPPAWFTIVVFAFPCPPEAETSKTPVIRKPPSLVSRSVVP